MTVTVFITKCIALVIIKAVVNGHMSTSSFVNVIRVSQNITYSTDGKTNFDWKQVINGLCFIELQSWGFDDPQHNGYAIVNGQLAVNYSRTNYSYSNADVRGINVNVLRTNDCATTDSRYFDTFALSINSLALAEYLRSLAIGTVVYGVSSDEVTYSLTDYGRDALFEIGVDVGALVYRGKLTFVAVVGRPMSNVTSISPNGRANLLMDAVVTRSADTSEIHPRESVTMVIALISSIVLNGILIVSIVIVCIVKTVKRCVTSHKSNAIAPVPVAKEKLSSEYTGLNRLTQGGDESASPDSYYEEITQRSASFMNTAGTNEAPVKNTNYLHLTN